MSPFYIPNIIYLLCLPSFLVYKSCQKLSILLVFFLKALNLDFDTFPQSIFFFLTNLCLYFQYIFVFTFSEMFRLLQEAFSWHSTSWF